MVRPVKIFDEFTNLPMTSSAKWQARNRKKGLCWCGKGKPHPGATQCLGCLLRKREAARKRIGYKGKKTGPKPIPTESAKETL